MTRKQKTPPCVAGTLEVVTLVDIATKGRGGGKEEEAVNKKR